MPDLLVRSFSPLLLAFQPCFTQPSFSSFRIASVTAFALASPLSENDTFRLLASPCMRSAAGPSRLRCVGRSSPASDLRGGRLAKSPSGPRSARGMSRP
jgi:hypothetical protein